MNVDELKNISSSLGYEYDLKLYPNRVEKWIINPKIPSLPDDLTENEITSLVNVIRFVSDDDVDIVVVDLVTNSQTYKKIREHLTSNGYKELVNWGL